MCDTQLLQQDGSTFFAKNSDREPSEPQVVVSIPAVAGHQESYVQTTYLTIPQLSDRYAVILSKPAWIWGAEMGVNSHGVVIGNEAVFTRLVDRENSRLLGMDLVRLGLERGASARQALDCISSLLEEHGQGGPAGFRNKSFRYDNSFIVADPQEAWILETAGRHWVAKRIEEYGAISNALTIEHDFELCSDGLIDFAMRQGYHKGSDDFNFARSFDTRFMKFMGCAVQRRRLSMDSLQQISSAFQPSIDLMAASLRGHASNVGHSNRDVCMHAAGLARPSQTCGSMIVQLQKGRPPRVMVTGTSAPCLSLFQPLKFADDFQKSQSLLFHDGDEPRNSLWYRFERVHRLAMIDSEFRRDLIADRNATEQDMFAAHRGKVRIDEAQARAERWHGEWTERATSVPIRHRLFSARDQFWKRLNRLDGIADDG